MLKKPQRPNYTFTNIYRLIALLNTLGKIIKLVIVTCISKLAKNYRLLLDKQIGARKGCSANIALQLLVK